MTFRLSVSTVQRCKAKIWQESWSGSCTNFLCGIGINIPRWVENLDKDHWLRAGMLQAIKDTFKEVRKLREAKGSIQGFSGYDFIKKVNLSEINAGVGNMLLNIELPDNLFYKVLSDATGPGRRRAQAYRHDEGTGANQKGI